MMDDIDKQLILLIQQDIPLSLDPYGEIAEKVGCSKELVLERLRNFSKNGSLKRIAAILHHKDSGYKVNGMFVCEVDGDAVEEVGKKLALLESVSHCYERKRHEDWPYNLYGMIHGMTEYEVEQIVNDFVQKLGIENYNVLYSIEEFKKTSMKYF